MSVKRKKSYVAFATYRHGIVMLSFLPSIVMLSFYAANAKEPLVYTCTHVRACL